MYEYGLENNKSVRVFSMHGPQPAAKGNKYFPSEIFKGFHSARIKYVKEAVQVGKQADTVVLSHINLMLAGWLIKKANPKVKVVLIAHGIEVWKKLNRRQLMMLRACDRIVSVSQFTADKIKELHGIPAEKCSVLNNCIDPFFTRPEKKEKDPVLMKRYGFAADDIILLTLTRLSEKDRYKGYDYVLKSMETLIKTNPKIKYLLAGSYDKKEKIFVDSLINSFGLRSHVVLTGYVEEEELPAHFGLADIYVMPSKKEGFGIVFVEAMYYGIPAIAGNADGSVDALLNGDLGILVNPDDPKAITAAIRAMLADPVRFIPDHELLMEHFSYEAYKRKLEEVLN